MTILPISSVLPLIFITTGLLVAGNYFTRVRSFLYTTRSSKEKLATCCQEQYSFKQLEGSPPLIIDQDQFMAQELAKILKYAASVNDAVMLPPYSTEDALKMLGILDVNSLLPYMTVPLHPFQLIGVAWLTNQELLHRCGFLADEMGLGKTIQVIATICLDFVEDQHQKTLIVVPASLCDQWVYEFQSKTDGTLRVFLWHGSRRKQGEEEFNKAHIIITSYELLRHEWIDPEEEKDDNISPPAARQKSPLFETSWHRVVLDEAHLIRNQDTRTSRAALSLSAILKLFLSGLGDLYPMCKYFDVPMFNDEFYFTLCFTSQEKAAPLVAALGLRRLLIQKYFLRRKTDTILDGKKLLDLPPQTIETHILTFSSDERRAYDGIERRLLLNDNLFYLPHSVPKSYTHVFVKWLRWRQCCVHPYLIQEPEPKEDPEDLIKSSKTTESTSDPVHHCDLCDNPIIAGDEANLLAFGICEKHHFCETCIFEVKYEIQHRAHQLGSGECPLCTTTGALPLTVQQRMEQREEAFAPEASEFRPSTKFEFMMGLLLQWREDTETAKDKTIIVSQFTGALDLAAVYLSKKEFEYTRYQGGMSRALRAQSVRAFMEDEETMVLLLSLKAGGLGLNLTRANRVIMLDPGWNVAVEDQAFARCHRLGQNKRVFVHRLVMKDTIEERMLKEYQARKKLLADAALGDLEKV